MHKFVIIVLDVIKTNPTVYYAKEFMIEVKKDL
jgi:hypothetical protein